MELQVDCPGQNESSDIKLRLNVNHRRLGQVLSFKPNMMITGIPIPTVLDVLKATELKAFSGILTFDTIAAI